MVRAAWQHAHLLQGPSSTSGVVVASYIRQSLKLTLHTALSQELKSVGMIPVALIRDIRYKEFPIDDKQHCFELITAQSRYLISASSDREMRSWAAAINYARHIQLNNGRGSNKTGTLRIEVHEAVDLGTCHARNRSLAVPPSLTLTLSLSRLFGRAEMHCNARRPIKYHHEPDIDSVSGTSNFTFANLAARDVYGCWRTNTV